MQIELIILFFIVALVYSSVGLGGGSSYLALLTLFGIDFLSLRAIALLCNVTVVFGSVVVFWRNGLIDWKKILPLILISVPAAFLGGYIKITEEFFFILLGLTLLVAALIMFFQPKISNPESFDKISKAQSGGIGGGIGLLSGIVGIGGGIFLSPILHLLNWDRAIKIGAAASVYILVNSISGLLGQLHHLNLTSMNLPFVVSLMAAVLIGGQLGVRVGIFKLNPRLLKRVTALLIFLVAIRLLYKYLLNT